MMIRFLPRQDSRSLDACAIPIAKPDRKTMIDERVVAELREHPRRRRREKGSACQTRYDRPPIAAGASPVFSSRDIPVMICAGAKGFWTSMLLGTPLAVHSAAAVLVA